MAPIIEANSLTSVKSIASNPPSHPAQQLRHSLLPLVLYIARVPGSRDVFLTPMKPREKVVTAEDIQSSLYYIHINCEDDYDENQLFSGHSFKPPENRPIIRDDGELFHPSEQYVTSTASNVSSLDSHIQGPVEFLPPQPTGQHSIQRKPTLPARKQIVPPQLSQSNQQPGVRRPLPELPAEEAPNASLHGDNIRWLRYAEHTSMSPYSRDYSTHPETLKQVEQEAWPRPGTLTLIRRNPGSSEQWNVASIHDPAVQDITSASQLLPSNARRTKKGGTPLYLDITNPGYAQFISQHCQTESRTGPISTSSTDSDSAPIGTFRRRLFMPGSKYGDHYYAPGHQKHLSLSSGEDVDMQRATRDRHSVDLGALSPPRADRRSKGYTFDCPWNGKCAFTTGATGKSLKCWHSLPDTGGVNEVSELRFNLPTSSKNTSTAVQEKRSSYFSRHMHRFSSDDGGSTPSVVVNEMTGGIDLSLGQEKAGGGFGGKQAKLGKLVIEPEGFKMLDLLVAANIGLWWRAYERE